MSIDWRFNCLFMFRSFDKSAVFPSAARRKEARFTLLKHEGNSLVKKGLFLEAMEKYSECLSIKPDECAVYTNRLVQNKTETFMFHFANCALGTQLRLDLLKAQIWLQFFYTSDEIKRHDHFGLLMIFITFGMTSGMALHPSI